MVAQMKHGHGSDGECLCPQCGERISKRSGVTCEEELCPTCGAQMMSADPHKRKHQEEED